MRTFQVPNEWQELDEEEVSDGGQELLSSYGPFSVMLYSRIKKLKLFEIPGSSLFLEKVIKFYVTNAKKMETDFISVKNLKTLIGLFPSYKRFNILLSSRRRVAKDMTFFKLALDIMTQYYQLTEIPLYRKLQCEVIPLALTFYKLLPTECLTEINNELQSALNKSK